MKDREKWLSVSSAMFGVDIDVLRDAAGNMELAWDMDDAFVLKLKALGRRMLELGMISREPDYDRLVERRFVDVLRHEGLS